MAEGDASVLTCGQFEALAAYGAAKGRLRQRDAAARAGLSLDSANCACRELEGAGLIADGLITAAGREALAPYRVDNAIIMAAGLSSRFAPISYDLPKGLLRVRGEVLIERQIRQLQEAGIDDITVVVGYKKEHFFYLEDAFGVSIVVSDEYAKRNNHSSLMAVRERLGNTYICSSDDYFTSNPFERYVHGAYYAAEYRSGATDEWCISTGPHGRIVGARLGGADAWVMLGHAYFDRAFSRTFVAALEADYDKPATAGKLWEEVYLDHIDELSMVMRPYEEGVIYEFDSLDEVRDFDPLFLENVASEAFDNIARMLGCEKTDVCDIYPLKQGITNLSCHFRVGEAEYVYRHPGAGTDSLIDRQVEMEALRVARGLGLDGTFIGGDAEKGWKISRFVANSRQLDPHDGEDLRRAMKIARTLHASDARVERRFSFYGESRRYRKLLDERGGVGSIPGFADEERRIAALHEAYAADASEECLCHNDFFHLNFLVGEKGDIHLIDWEYAGMADPAQDIATFAVCCQLSESEIDAALAHYFGRPATEDERRHQWAAICLAGWCWYLWALVKEVEGDDVGEWLYIYYRYAKEYLKKASARYGIGECEGDAR